MENIYPIFDKTLTQSDKEKNLNQKAKVIWFIGLSGSGKSTIAQNLEKLLVEKGFNTMLLDGDNLRSGLNSDLDFSAEARTENLRRTAEVAKLFKSAGIVTLTSFITPTEAARAKAKSIIGASEYIEIYVSTPLEECERRDIKGLYAKARAGLIPDFTGISSPFEQPKAADLSIDTTHQSIEECVNQVFQYILPKITLE